MPKRQPFYHSIYGDYNNGTPAWYGLSCFTLAVVSVSFVYTWFRLRTGSLWTGVLLHASHNLFVQGVFTPLTRDTGPTKYVIDEFGLALPVVSLIVAWLFWRKRGLLTPMTGEGAQPLAEVASLRKLKLK